MKSIIIKPKNSVLQKYVQYFLFFRKSDNCCLNYTTFPNNNLCLAIYKENVINYFNRLNDNNCIVKKGNNSFTSRFYGFHKTPFQVEINSPLDQICIIFYPSALRVFSSESYDNLMNSEGVFEEVFSLHNTNILEEIFDEEDFLERTNKLEELLLRKINHVVPNKLKEALQLISRYNDNSLNVEILANKLGISTPTLFRLFKYNLGQCPKSYLKTIRFRSVLDQILNKQNLLTKIAYNNEYYDQAHFIKDFKTFSGYSPIQLMDKVSVEQDELTWIYNKK